jgi:MacB-like periplasmic core domain/FtsX-like permease family
MAKFYPLLSANLPDFRIWQRDCRSFASIAVAESRSADLTGAGETVEIPGVRASANLFDVLGIVPALGRNFLPEEDEAGRGHVVILTDEFWRGNFHADLSIVGRTITLDEARYVVAGVLPASFHFPAQLGPLASFGRKIDFFEPLDGERDYERGLIGEFDFAAIGRLKPSVSPGQALAELNVVQARIAQQAKEGLDLKAAISPLESEVVGSARRGLILLLAAVGAVLLIVCVNLANLMLARVPGRMREAAIRIALGATRWQLFRRLLTESLLLGIIGGIFGVCLGSLGVYWLVRAAPPGLPRLHEVRLACLGVCVVPLDSDQRAFRRLAGLAAREGRPAGIPKIRRRGGGRKPARTALARDPGRARSRAEQPALDCRRPAHIKSCALAPRQYRFRDRKCSDRRG